MQDGATEPNGGSPKEFAEFMKVERTRWAEAVRLTGATAE